MAIVSSVVTPDNHQQIDGRTYVVEIHTDSTGATHRFEYLAEVGTNYQSVADARALALAEQLAESEFEVLIGS